MNEEDRIKSYLCNLRDPELCDLAWRAGLDWADPWDFALGRRQLSETAYQRLLQAIADPKFNINGEGVTPAILYQSKHRAEWDRILSGPEVYNAPRGKQ
jgi:hypothetical protein